MDSHMLDATMLLPAGEEKRRGRQGLCWVSPFGMERREEEAAAGRATRAGGESCSGRRGGLLAAAQRKTRGREAARGRGGERCWGRRGALLGPAGRAAGGCLEEDESREGWRQVSNFLGLLGCCGRE
ncbi:unnamed protein product [Linum trigynum]|uniref:Uncharacterized protein n=2 Tax=Linum trigynum TaxID=586398 RepID=A0AAV2CQR6_9ROSI